MNIDTAVRYAMGKRKQAPIYGQLTPEIEGWIAEFGQEYKVVNLPTDIQQGPISTCFDTCLMNILMSNKYQYVEGKAFDGASWTYHAWLTDGTHAYDPTWKVIGKDGMENANNSMRYIGFVIPTGFLMFFNFQTKYAGVLGNRARYKSAVDQMLEYKRKKGSNNAPIRLS